IRERRHIPQRHRLVGQQGRREHRQRRVLGPIDPHPSEESLSALNQERIHGVPSSPRRMFGSALPSVLAQPDPAGLRVPIYIGAQRARAWQTKPDWIWGRSGAYAASASAVNAISPPSGWVCAPPFSIFKMWWTESPVRLSLGGCNYEY